MEPPNALLHRYAATNVSVDRHPMLTNDMFVVGDHILVHSNLSTHQGRFGTITHLGHRRLSITFEDRLPGSYVDYKDALLIPSRGVQSYGYTDNAIYQADAQGNAAPLDANRVLSHFSRTASHAIAVHWPDELEMERWVSHFEYELRSDLGSRICELLEENGKL
jgi:hypothetical protein